VSPFAVSRSLWYADGLRWIGSLFHGAADFLDRPSTEPAPLDPMPHDARAEEWLFELRHRIHTQHY
jgi:hypothetical protein